MHRLETNGPNSLIGLLEILEDIGKPTDIAKLDDSLDEERTMLSRDDVLFLAVSVQWFQ